MERGLSELQKTVLQVIGLRAERGDGDASGLVWAWRGPSTASEASPWSRALDRLERRGLIERDGDGRA